MKLSLSLVGVLGLVATNLLACAAPTDADPGAEDLASDDAAVTAAKASCSSAAYNAAFTKYKAAVDHAKLRNRGEVCDDGTMLYDIAADLQAAVSTCGQFRTVIATSVWAQPVRDALKGNLALASVDGRLTTIGSNGKPSLAGLAAALPGTTVFGPAPGVYGNMSKLTFAGAGKATFSTLTVSDAGKATWSNKAATYTVTAKANGAADVTVTVGAAKTTYAVTPEPSAPYELLFTPKSGDALRSMPSECEA
ncbi:MAG: hypothetical protein JWP97_6100 [Labilithrix sp.]|nr:hypothetical protein [Labilithrix sp.]